MASSAATVSPRLFRVALLSMPWAPFNRPSLQLAVLKAYLEEQVTGVTVTCHHHYLEVAKALGPEAYNWLALSGWAGEALYAPHLFPAKSNSAARLFSSEAGRFKAKALGPSFSAGVARVAHCLNDWLARLPLTELELVGFSVCFNQLLPALTAASRIKQLRPDLPVVFGGSACGDREMAGALLAVFPQVDYVVCGEGELGLAALVDDLRQTCRKGAARIYPDSEGVREQGRLAPQIDDLDSLPRPDFRDYFAELPRVFTDESFFPELPVEFSRGCWWGKCSFCNLNLQWCGYRHKSAGRMLDEVRFLARVHGCLDFFFTDNVLPFVESRDFFRQLESDPADLHFFAELRSEQSADLELFSRGGLAEIQVGIEALSPGLLRKMNKGGSVIANLAMMKRALACGLRLSGNLITELPGATAEEVMETLAVLDYAWPLAPLQPARYFLGRGSPMDLSPESYGIRARTIHIRARALYPAETLASLPQLVKGFRADRQTQRRLWRPVHLRLRQWQNFHSRRSAPAHLYPPLSYRDGGDFLLLRQETPDGAVLRHRLRGTSRRLYLACEEIREISDLDRDFSGIGRPALVKFLDDLAAKRLLFREGDRVLALAVRRKRKER